MGSVVNTESVSTPTRASASDSGSVVLLVFAVNECAAFCASQISVATMCP